MVALRPHFLFDRHGNMLCAGDSTLRPQHLFKKVGEDVVRGVKDGRIERCDHVREVTHNAIISVHLRIKGDRFVFPSLIVNLKPTSSRACDSSVDL